MADSALRFMVPSLVIASPVMLCVSGTCLTRTTLSIGLESVIHVSGDCRPLPAAECRSSRAGRTPRGWRIRVPGVRFVAMKDSGGSGGLFAWSGGGQTPAPVRHHDVAERHRVVRESGTDTRGKVVMSG